MKRIIVDSSSLIYSAFFTTGSLSYDGKDTGIIYGFLRKVLRIGEKFKTNKFYFCFDHRINYREKIYPEYKANRNNRKKEMTDIEKQQKQSRIKQTDELREKVLYRLGFKNIYYQEGYESDDLMALLAIALLVVSDNSASGKPLVGRNQKDQQAYDDARKQILPNLIYKICEL